MSKNEADASNIPDLPNDLAMHALVPRSTVEKLVGLSRSPILARVAAGTFPQPVRLSLRCSRWRLSDVHQWLQQQKPQHFQQQKEESTK